MFELPLSNLILLTSNDNKVITKLKIKEKQMSKKYETELDMEFDVVTRNIYVQLHGLDNHMEKFIDMDIEEYLNSIFSIFFIIRSLIISVPFKKV